MLFTPKEIQILIDEGKLSLYASQENEIKRYQNDFEKIKKIYTSFLFIELSIENDDNIFYEHCEIHLAHQDLTITIKKLNFINEFSIFCKDLYKLPYLAGFRISEYYSNAKKPNKIHVLTENKIMQWINFYENMFNHFNELSYKHKKEIDSFLNEIKNPSFHKYIIFHNENYTKGEALKNGILFKWELQNNEYMYCQCEIYYKANTTECDKFTSFYQLSDNKYIETSF